MKPFLILVLLFAISNGQAKEISINITGSQGEGVANVVAYLTAKNVTKSPAPQNVSIMDQINTQFSPHILPVQKDSHVRFPNSDSIKHHVYSFSPAKTFELQLYKDLQADPLMFSKKGVVELGCNVHDWMLGYIFVVDTPFFAKTDEKGHVVMDVPEGEYQLDIWHPRIQDDLSALSTNISIKGKSEANIVLKKALLPNLNQYEDESEEFSDYE